MVKVITIDGPSGAGKGTLCHLLAQKLGWHILDSGAIYRAFALNAVQQNIDIAALQPQQIADLAQLDLQFELRSDANLRALLDGDDVTDQLRLEACAQGASKAASIPDVRAALLQWQRDFAREPGLVTDGRDMGTVVFPNADVKFFVTASAEARAERRYKQLAASGQAADLKAITDSIRERDARDSSRAIAPLCPADDAILIDTDNKTIADVLAVALADVDQVLQR